MDKSQLQNCKPKKRQNGPKQIAKKLSLSETKKRQNLLQTVKMKNIFQNKIEKIKKEINLLQDILDRSEKRQNLFAKRQNLS